MLIVINVSAWLLISFEDIMVDQQYFVSFGIQNYSARHKMSLNVFSISNLFIFLELPMHIQEILVFAKSLLICL